ncbi:hypothetical protein N657DRAFT_447557 [Parathielavia appendiculata]|uniref:Uncharacterized protein n=1 Tax=Parathielavia appendiculata TaxID=2587402 RepID=A0AAN6TYK3_9PEZI|nr:hypothetical protein N657DRAFT_447557 [Parathielavia appendiculata]
MSGSDMPFPCPLWLNLFNPPRIHRSFHTYDDFRTVALRRPCVFNFQFPFRSPVSPLHPVVPVIPVSAARSFGASGSGAAVDPSPFQTGLKPFCTAPAEISRFGRFSGTSAFPLAGLREFHLPLLAQLFLRLLVLSSPHRGCWLRIEIVD